MTHLTVIHVSSQQLDVIIKENKSCVCPHFNEAAYLDMYIFNVYT